jgi:hypothetical protein
METRGGADVQALRDQWLMTRQEGLEEIGRYAVAMEIADLELLMDPRLLYGPPRLLVRRGGKTAEVWLDSDDLRFSRTGPFTEADRRRILALVEKHGDELIGWWFHFREDFKRGRLRRNPMAW